MTKDQKINAAVRKINSALVGLELADVMIIGVAVVSVAAEELAEGDQAIYSALVRAAFSDANKKEIASNNS